MGYLAELYRSSLASATDLYQLTMAYAYWKKGLAERRAVFHMFFRRNPFAGGITVAAGLAPLAELLEGFRYEADDLAFLRTVPGNDGKRIFPDEFLDYLGRLRFTCDVDAIPEGTAVFPQEPLVRVSGPILQAQLIETPLLNILNFQTLVATKAARVVTAAGNAPVLEFGLRRAQGPDGGVSASRAAYIGGCAGTSNVLAGKLLDIPVKGTHAHSWVMCFADEEEAFRAYAEAMPNNCVFLVDTYDTIQGVRHAVTVGAELRERGAELIGIRLDSGDLAYLAKESRRMLDEAGFPDAAIIASNDLDEQIICSLREQGAPIGVWGVGTKLVTAYDQPALGGVYKLAATYSDTGERKDCLKLSDHAAKISTPGVLGVSRYLDGTHAVADAIHDAEQPPTAGTVIVDPLDPTRRKRIPAGTAIEELLVPVFRNGCRVHELPDLPSIRARTRAQLQLFHPGVKRFVNPHEYPVGLEVSLHERKTAMILAAKGYA